MPKIIWVLYQKNNVLGQTVRWLLTAGKRKGIWVLWDRKLYTLYETRPQQTHSKENMSPAEAG